MISIFIHTNASKIPQIFDTVDSCLTNSVKPVEIVVFVSGIEDGKHVSDLKSLKDRSPLINVSGVKSNIDHSIGLNCARKQCVGDYVLLMDASSILAPFALESLSTVIGDGGIAGVSWCLGDGVFLDIDTVDANCIYSKYFPFANAVSPWDICRRYGSDIVNDTIDSGSMLIHADVLKHTSFKEPYEFIFYGGSDNVYGIYYEFMMEILYKYHRSIIVDAPLTKRIL